MSLRNEIWKEGPVFKKTAMKALPAFTVFFQCPGTTCSLGIWETTEYLNQGTNCSSMDFRSRPLNLKNILIFPMSHFVLPTPDFTKVESGTAQTDPTRGCIQIKFLHFKQFLSTWALRESYPRRLHEIWSSDHVAQVLALFLIFQL